MQYDWVVTHQESGVAEGQSDRSFQRLVCSRFSFFARRGVILPGGPVPVKQVQEALSRQRMLKFPLKTSCGVPEAKYVVFVSTCYVTPFQVKLCMVSAGALVVQWWKCWQKSLHGLNMRLWQPYSRSPPSQPTHCCPPTPPTRHETLSAASSWRPNIGPVLRSCSDIPSPRFCAETCLVSELQSVAQDPQ